jgi:hypothetical protein
MKKLLFTAAFALPFAAQAEPIQVPKFFEVHVEMTQAGKVIYAADALLPRNQEINDGQIQQLPMAYSCPPPEHFTVPPTYKSGLAISAFAYGHWDLAGIEFQYTLAEAKGPVETMMGRCTVQKVISTVQYANPNFRIREGETLSFGGDGLGLKFTLKRMYVEQPAGIVAGRFVQSMP